MPELHITVRSDHPIPHDVLVEHIAVALRDFNFAGKVDVKMAHPFDDKSNVVFDDDVQHEEYTGPNAHVLGEDCCETPSDPYPLTTRVIDFLKRSKRG